MQNVMGERQNTLVCAFDQQSPRISAYDIHEWIQDTLCLRESEVVMIHIDGPRRHVYIKFSDPSRMQDLLTSTNGQAEHGQTNGEISKVRSEAVGLSMRKVRIANLPPEVPDRTLSMALGKFGCRDIQGETWSSACRYPVANGIRVVMLNLVQHIPSHIIVAGHRTLILYGGQPITCYGCNETGHLYQVCPQRRTRAEDTRATMISWADVAAKGTTQPQANPGVMDVGMDTAETVNTEPPSSPKRTKKLKVDRQEESSPARRQSRTRNTNPSSL
jgi:hypothetical protein